MRMRTNPRAVVSLILVAVLALLTACTSTKSGSEGTKNLIQEIQSKGELRVGYAVEEPFSFKNAEGKWVGTAVDVMDVWAQTLGVKMVPVDTTWDTMIAGLQAGKYDVAAGFNRKPARSLAISFSRGYSIALGVFAVDNRKSKVTTDWKELDKAGFTVAVAAGSAEAIALRNTAKNMTVQEMTDVNEARLALESGRVDAMFMTGLSQSLYAREHDWVRIIIPDPVIDQEPVAFGIRQGYRWDDIEALNIQIETLVNLGEMTQIERKYDLQDPRDYIYPKR